MTVTALPFTNTAFNFHPANSTFFLCLLKHIARSFFLSQKPIKSSFVFLPFICLKSTFTKYFDSFYQINSWKLEQNKNYSDVHFKKTFSKLFSFFHKDYSIHEEFIKTNFKKKNDSEWFQAKLSFLARDLRLQRRDCGLKLSANRGESKGTEKWRIEMNLA